MNNIENEQETEVDETELQRLLDGGLNWCNKEKECGHKCEGVKDEDQCLPCLQPSCTAGEGAAA